MNDTLVTIGLAAAVILAAVEEFRSQGSSFVAWAAIIGFGVLLLAHVIK